MKFIHLVLVMGFRGVYDHLKQFEIMNLNYSPTWIKIGIEITPSHSALDSSFLHSLVPYIS